MQDRAANQVLPEEPNEMLYGRPLIPVRFLGTPQLEFRLVVVLVEIEFPLNHIVIQVPFPSDATAGNQSVTLSIAIELRSNKGGVQDVPPSLDTP